MLSRRHGRDVIRRLTTSSGLHQTRSSTLSFVRGGVRPVRQPASIDSNWYDAHDPGFDHVPISRHGERAARDPRQGPPCGQAVQPGRSSPTHYRSDRQHVIGCTQCFDCVIEPAVGRRAHEPSKAVGVPPGAKQLHGSFTMLCSMAPGRRPICPHPLWRTGGWYGRLGTDN